MTGTEREKHIFRRKFHTPKPTFYTQKSREVRWYIRTTTEIQYNGLKIVQGSKEGLGMMPERSVGQERGGLCVSGWSLMLQIMGRHGALLMIGVIRPSVEC